ncbi:hypothetical protein [Nesterenkonia populi]
MPLSSRSNPLPRNHYDFNEVGLIVEVIPWKLIGESESSGRGKSELALGPRSLRSFSLTCVDPLPVNIYAHPRVAALKARPACNLAELRDPEVPGKTVIRRKPAVRCRQVLLMKNTALDPLSKGHRIALARPIRRREGTHESDVPRREVLLGKLLTEDIAWDGGCRLTVNQHVQMGSPLGLRRVIEPTADAIGPKIHNLIFHGPADLRGRGTGRH